MRWARGSWRGIGDREKDGPAKGLGHRARPPSTVHFEEAQSAAMKSTAATARSFSGGITITIV